MQNALNKVTTWANECGLTLSPNKTNAMLFTRKRKIPEVNLDLFINGNKINYVDSVTCLGVILDSKLTWNKHIDNKIKQAKQYIHSVKTSIGRTWGPTPDKMLWLWTAVVRPKITYACYIWGTHLNQKQKDKINKIQRLALMQTANFRYTTPETGLDVVLGQMPLDLHILQRAILTHLRVREKVTKGWAGKAPGPKGKPGHINRMENKQACV